MSDRSDWVSAQKKRNAAWLKILVVCGLSLAALLSAVELFQNFGSLVDRLDWTWNGANALVSFVKPLMFGVWAVATYRLKDEDNG